jgi:DHA3 family multidrug efflux protein-like MFS transporter
MKTFYQVLGNTLIATVTNFTVWFALTFYVFLETESVFATGMISGVFLTFTALSGFWFGSLVDHYHKKTVMLWSSIFSLIAYAIGFALYLILPPEMLTDISGLWLWVFITVLIAGVIAGNIRNIAQPTLITMLVPEEGRARANGLAGVVGGLSFGTVSVISGLLVGYSGMFHVLILAIILTLIAITHLLSVRIPENKVAHLEDAPKKVDIRGTLILLAGIPGIIALIFFTTFNNFLGGVFMSLMDAYGLSLVSVEAWGFILGALSFSFMIGGAAIAKWGLGSNPLRALMIANLFIWLVCCLFTIQPSIMLLVVGMFLYMAVIPYIEAAEHTVIQKIVPLERQGRVFGFAQSVEQMASPLTAFVMGPIAQFIFIPFMTTGAGVGLIGDWFGIGPARGIALVFTLTGIIGFIVTLIAFRSRSYRLLSDRYRRPESSEATIA